MVIQEPKTSILEEVINATTHGIGVIVGIAGFVILLILSVKTHNPWAIVGIAIYGTTLILTFLASTLFHGLVFTKAKRVFRVLDHSAIFLLIAGTYTPFALTVLRGPIGWALLAFVWTGAICGILLKVFAMRRNSISLALYLLLGWVGIFTAKQLADSLPLSTILFLVGGGLLYTAGAALYCFKQWVFNHSMGHICMLAGSNLHLMALFLLIY
jgi:hemolysin III